MGLPWQEPDGGIAATGAGSGRTDLHREVDETGRSADRRSDFNEVYGDWSEVAGRIEAPAAALASDARAALSRAESDPAGLSDDDYLALLTMRRRRPRRSWRAWPTRCAARWWVTTSPTS